jgi:hypothetical protein
MVYKILALITGTLLFSACGGSSTPEGAPYVARDSLGDGTAVSVAPQLAFFFNKEIDEKKNSETNFFLYVDSNDTRIDGTVTLSGEQAVFVPSEVLEYATDYRMEIREVVDLTATRMKSAFVRRFTTTDFLMGITPQDGATGVSVFADVTVTFGETISPASLVFGVSNLTLSQTTTDNKTFTFTPTGGTGYDSSYSGMNPSTTFTVTVSAATDSHGKTLPSSVSTTFTTVPPDVTPPMIVLIQPADGASDIPADVNITLQFDEDLIAPTVLDLDLLDGAMASVPFGFSYDAATRTARLAPLATLDYAQEYTVSLTNIRDIFGNVLTASLTFTTSTILKATTPEDGDSGVEVDTAVTALFEGVIDATGATFSLVDSGAAPVAGSAVFGANSATFTPSDDLDFSAGYTATLSGIKDLSGNLLADQSWSFSTKADDLNPQFLSASPANMATGVSTGTTIVATFDEDITGNIKCIVQDSQGISVTGSIAAIGATVTFTPSAPLKSSETYTVFLSGVTDPNGNKTQTQFWSFDTL